MRISVNLSLAGETDDWWLMTPPDKRTTPFLPSHEIRISRYELLTVQSNGHPLWLAVELLSQSQLEEFANFQGNKW